MAIFLFHFLTIVSSPVSDVQDAAEAADDCEESLWMLVQVVSLVSLGQGSGLTVLTTIRGIRATQSRPGCKYSQSKREREREWHKYCRFLLNIQQKAIFIGWIPGMAANSWCSDTRSRWGWRRGWSGWWPSCPWWRQTLGLCQDHSRGHMTWGWWSGGWSGSWWWPLTLRLHKFTFNPGLRKPSFNLSHFYSWIKMSCRGHIVWTWPG